MLLYDHTCSILCLLVMLKESNYIKVKAILHKKNQNKSAYFVCVLAAIKYFSKDG